MTLTKADFAERLFNELGIDKRKAKELVDFFFEEIKSSLEQGKPVKISGFGKLSFATKLVVRVGTRKQAKKSLLLPGGL